VAASGPRAEAPGQLQPPKQQEQGKGQKLSEAKSQSKHREQKEEEVKGLKVESQKFHVSCLLSGVLLKT